MSEQERNVHAKRSDETETEDVEAHVKAKAASVEGDDDGDDVEAHVRSSKS
ncbi:MAG: hypothetical protein ACJ77E_05225 [Gaiellaceae bacterium]